MEWDPSAAHTPAPVDLVLHHRCLFCLDHCRCAGRGTALREIMAPEERAKLEMLDKALVLLKGR